MVRAVVIAVALVALALLPCAVAMLIIHVDEAAETAYRALRRGCRRLRARVADYRAVRSHVTPEPAEPKGPPIEQIAADLRRLSRQRQGIATRSTVWFAAVQRAYDERLQQACRSLGVVEHLTGLDGLDRDIERLRLEALLEAEGLALGASDTPRPGDRWQDHC